MILHEAYHIFGGHFDALDTLAGEAAFRLDETGPAFSFDSRAPNPVPPNLAYFLELEADSSALQWLMQIAVPTTVQAFLDALEPGRDAIEPDGLFDLEEPARSAVFRALLAAIWLVMLLLESRRHGPSGTHPLSGARLLAATSTIMEQFAEIDVSLSAEGRSAVLDADQADDTIHFLTEVVKPVALAAWRINNRIEAGDGGKPGEVEPIDPTQPPHRQRWTR